MLQLETGTYFKFPRRQKKKKKQGINFFLTILNIKFGLPLPKVRLTVEIEKMSFIMQPVSKWYTSSIDTPSR